jgi:hypothetical protein
MSDSPTLQTITDVITAHAQANDQLDGNGIVTSWIIGYETAHTDAKYGIAHAFQYAGSESSPATALGLAHMLTMALDAEVTPTFEDDDEEDEA